MVGKPVGKAVRSSVGKSEGSAVGHSVGNPVGIPVCVPLAGRGAAMAVVARSRVVRKKFMLVAVADVLGSDLFSRIAVK